MVPAYRTVEFDMTPAVSAPIDKFVRPELLALQVTPPSLLLRNPIPDPA
jgi:hypothetical protein